MNFWNELESYVNFRYNQNVERFRLGDELRVYDFAHQRKAHAFRFGYFDLFWCQRRRCYSGKDLYSNYGKNSLGDFTVYTGVNPNQFQPVLINLYEHHSVINQIGNSLRSNVILVFFFLPVFSPVWSI